MRFKLSGFVCCDNGRKITLIDHKQTTQKL